MTIQLEYTTTDQILLTWGPHENRAVLRFWHISQKDEAEAEFKQIMENKSVPEIDAIRNDPYRKLGNFVRIKGDL